MASKMMDDKKIVASIIIPTLNPDKKLVNCISCLEQQSEKNFEIIIVDNGSNYDFKQIECTYEDINIIKNEKNFGFSKAVNIGIKNSNGKYFVLLNDDAHPPENWLENLIKVAESDKKNGLVTSKLRFNKAPYLIQNTGNTNSKRFGVAISGDIGRTVPLSENGSEVLAPCGAALLIKKEFIDDVGFFDEDYFAYPSLYEGFGICLLEAMYCGLPIVSTDNGGQTDFLVDGKNALMVPVEDSEALAGQIKRLIDDESLRLQMSENNKKDIMKFYIENIAAKYERFFEIILRRGE